MDPDLAALMGDTSSETPSEETPSEEPTGDPDLDALMKELEA